MGHPRNTALANAAQAELSVLRFLDANDADNEYGVPLESIRTAMANAGFVDSTAEDVTGRLVGACLAGYRQVNGATDDGSLTELWGCKITGAGKAFLASRN